jgi:REP element-mobilizing transposase RayT
MGFAYNIKDQGALYFVTFTVHQWVDVFTRPQYIDIYLNSLRYCQQHKGLLVYAWVVMSNHVHLIVRAENDNLSDIIRDHKKFTAKAIYEAIRNNPAESRKEWLLRVLTFNDAIWFWEEGYHGEEIFGEAFYQIKLKYLHENPVRAGIVAFPEHYIHSSASDHMGFYKGKLDIFGL